MKIIEHKFNQLSICTGKDMTHDVMNIVIPILNILPGVMCMEEDIEDANENTEN